MAAWTRCRVDARTAGLPLSTRDTVWWETLAWRATSCMTTARRAGRGLSSGPEDVNTLTTLALLTFTVNANKSGLYR